MGHGAECHRGQRQTPAGRGESPGTPNPRLVAGIHLTACAGVEPKAPPAAATPLPAA